MLRNLKLRNKLIAIIAAPLAALVAFAAVGAVQRRDTAQSSKRDGRVIAAVQADGAVAQALEAEAAQAVSSRVQPTAGDGATAKTLRARTDASVAELHTALARLDVAKLSTATQAAISAMDDRVAALGSLRAAVDGGGLPWAGITDTYGQAVSSVVTVARQVAGEADRPEVQTGLANLAALGQVKADVSESGNLLHGVLLNGSWPDQTTQTRFLSNADTEDVDLAIFKAGASPGAAAAYRNASSTASVSFVDSTRQSVREGNLTQAIAQRTRWAPAVTDKVAKLHDIETGVGADLANQNASRVAAAERAASLFILLAAAVVLLALLVAGAVARSLAHRMRTLTDAADRLSERELPRLVAALENPDEDELGRLAANLEPIEVTGSDELGRLATSYNHVQRVAVEVATEQAALLQRGIADTFVNLARRNQGLLDRQIEFIDQLEMGETDPGQLEDLFKLDHLATRMRRNAESLLVLAGAEPTRRRGEPVPLASVARAAIGEVEDFARIDLLTFDPVYVTRNASVDVTHLLAELMDNAAAFSPPDTRVEVAGHRSSSGGYVLSITDHGIGMTEEQLQEANGLLAAPPAVGLSLSRSLGFIVIGRLATRFDIGVRLFAGSSGGVTAVVTLPGPLVVEQADAPELDELDDFEPMAPELSSGKAVAASDLERRWDIGELLEAERPVDLRGPTHGVTPPGELPRRAHPQPLGADASTAGAHEDGDSSGSTVEHDEQRPDGPSVPGGDLPPLPVADAGAPLRFGDLPPRPTRQRPGAPQETGVQPAAAASATPMRPSDPAPGGPKPRAPIRFSQRPDRLHGDRLDNITPPPLPATAPASATLEPLARRDPSRASTSLDGVATASPPSPPPALTPSPPPALTPPAAGGELARRVPGAAKAQQEAAEELPVPEDGEAAVGPSKRSAAQVRSVLASYRSGLDRGRTRSKE